MIWKEYLNKIAAKLTEYLKNDIQYGNMPMSQIRQIAWREIELFVEDLKKWPPEKLIIKEDTNISPSNQEKLRSFLKKRLTGTPLAYILGKQRFYGLDFDVDRDTLIPRPETEELVEHVLKHISRNAARYAPTGSILIDIGTGSGCILISILKNLPKNIKLSAIYAVDKSKKALAVAKRNVKRHLGGKFRVNFINKSLLPNDLSLSKKYIIVANLPYLSEKEYQYLSPEVKKYEPKSALVGGNEGHELICKLIDQITSFRSRNRIPARPAGGCSVPNFDLFLEILPPILTKIEKHLAKKDVSIKIKTKRDLSGKVRFMHLIFQDSKR